MDEFGATLRPGIIEFLQKLKQENFELYLWTNSARERAEEILNHHKLKKYFSKFIFREDYDPLNKGIKKDIRKINGEMLIDDDASEIEYVKKLGAKGFRIQSYRKGGKTGKNEYEEIRKMISEGEGILKKLFG